MSPQLANRWQPNILIDGTGHACITGLDLMVITSDLEPTYSTERPAMQLAAPEVLNGGTAPSKEADMFSFAMVMIEVRAGSVITASHIVHHYKVFTGAAPFPHTPPTTVGVRILAGKRPERPAHSSLTDDLWDLNQRCWDQEPQLRPRIAEVVCYLRTVLAIKEGRAGGAGISAAGETMSRGSQQRHSLHRVSPSLTLNRVVYKD
jgi:hypothetical protein